MSWWIGYKSHEDFTLDNREEGSAQLLTTEGEKQFVAARDAATLLIGRSVVAPEGREIGITLSGHATPGHLAKDGSSPDSITVTIWQKHAPTGT